MVPSTEDSQAGQLMGISSGPGHNQVKSEYNYVFTVGTNLVMLAHEGEKKWLLYCFVWCLQSYHHHLHNGAEVLLETSEQWWMGSLGLTCPPVSFQDGICGVCMSEALDEFWEKEIKVLDEGQSQISHTDNHLWLLSSWSVLHEVGQGPLWGLTDRTGSLRLCNLLHPCPLGIRLSTSSLPDWCYGLSQKPIMTSPLPM